MVFPVTLVDESPDDSDSISIDEEVTRALALADHIYALHPGSEDVHVTVEQRLKELRRERKNLLRQNWLLKEKLTNLRNMLLELQKG